MMRTLTTLIVALLLSTASAQTVTAFANDLFSGLHATTVSCSVMGLDERPYSYSRCGMIEDNLLDLNKGIVERRIRNADLVVVIPWKRDVLAGTFPHHQIGFGNLRTGATYILNYVEIDRNNSFVWLVVNW